MKIIVVNISKTIKDLEPKEATERAWKLKCGRANRYEFVIGNNKGEIHYFKRLDAKPDDEHIDRIKFILKECSDTERKDIEQYIEKNIKDKKFKYVTTKYIN